MKMGMLSALADDPMAHTTSPYSCMIPNISRVAAGVQSVNRDTSKGTLSICSKWGRIFSMPRGNLAWNMSQWGFSMTPEDSLSQIIIIADLIFI